LADLLGSLFDVLQILGNGGPVRTPVRNPVAQHVVGKDGADLEPRIVRLAHAFGEAAH
jgi:hypothetical protein